MTDESEYEFKQLFVIPSVQRWEHLDFDHTGMVKNPFPISVKRPSPNRIGFMEVLDTYEAACEYCEEINVDTSSIMMIQVKVKK